MAYLDNARLHFTLYGNTPSKKNSRGAPRLGVVSANPLYGKWYTANFGKRKAKHRQEEWAKLREDLKDQREI
jgi:hypothetical protein